MSLEEEIQKSAKEIFTDGYEMSIGELMSLYKNEELIINPEFQRYFRWSISQKTKFIESILLGIPIPPIFVFQTKDGIWELVDGLQRLSTIFEFAGMLKKANGTLYESSVLEGTKLLPSLTDKKWEPSNEDADDGFTRPQQLAIRRARMRVEILKKESDPQSKYELFQRLNTGGSSLSEQEIRNCVMVMINRDFFIWIGRLTEYEPFRIVVAQTDTAEKRQRLSELALRFFVYRNIPYQSRLDVHEYLDDSMIRMASNPDFDYAGEEKVFKETFDFINQTLGDDAFRRFDGAKFVGQSLLSAYEIIAIGLSKNLGRILQLPEPDRTNFVQQKVRDLWGDPNFKRNSGAGVRGTTRLANLLSMGEIYFNPHE